MEGGLGGEVRNSFWVDASYSKIFFKQNCFCWGSFTIIRLCLPSTIFLGAAVQVISYLFPMQFTYIGGAKCISGNSVQLKTIKECWKEDSKIQFLWNLRRSWVKRDCVEQSWKEILICSQIIWSGLFLFGQKAERQINMRKWYFGFACQCRTNIFAILAHKFQFWTRSKAQ